MKFLLIGKNEKYVKETIDHILSSSSFSNENINKVVTKEHIKLKLESSSEQTLDTFLNMILNKQLIINKLELKRFYLFRSRFKMIQKIIRAIIYILVFIIILIFLLPKELL